MLNLYNLPYFQNPPFFQENDAVIFTAQRQNSPTNNCSYMASSVILKKELITCSGKITETFDKLVLLVLCVLIIDAE